MDLCHRPGKSLGAGPSDQEKSIQEKRGLWEAGVDFPFLACWILVFEVRRKFPHFFGGTWLRGRWRKESTSPTRAHENGEGVVWGVLVLSVPS